MENKYSEFKKINPFRRSSRVGNESNHMNKRRTNFPNRLDSETKPTLFSPPEVVDKEYKNEPFVSSDSEVESSEERVSSFIDEFSSMLDIPSLSYSGSMDDMETSLWQEQEQDEGKEENEEETEEESFSTRSDHVERRNKRNPFINEFTAMLEEYSGSEIDDEEDDNSFEEERVEDYQDQNENFAAPNPFQDGSLEQENPFVNEFTTMLDNEQSVHDEEEKTDVNLEEATIDDSSDESDKNNDSINEVYEDEEIEEESFHNDFTSILEEDSAEEQSEEYTDEGNNEEDQNDEIQEGTPFQEEFTSMLEEGSSLELGDHELEKPEPEIETNVEEDSTDEESEDFDQSDEEEIDHNESLQQEMLSILEETDDEDETSLQFMEDVIEYFDEIEDNRSFPLDRFLEFLMNVYCSDESDHVMDIDDEESVEEEEQEEEKINEYHAEDRYLEDPSVIVKLPVTLANVKLEVDILKEIELHTPISIIKKIRWSISSLKSKVLLPSSTVFFKGILVVEVEFEGQDTKKSIQSIQFPIEWEKSVDVIWMTTPEKAEEYEKEYTFDGNSHSMHLESYQKLAHEIAHDLKDIQCLWHYDVDRENQPKHLQLNGAVTLLIELSQNQYLPI
ncbi:hypothetical protein [Pontibacillus marinus]|nr:hypothetical protein [Pontibacillus marinus]